MGLYLYCVAAPEHPEPEGVVGVDDAAVAARTVEGLVVWVSRMPASPRASLERVRQHNAVVERACEAESVVPVRYGQWFEDEGRLAAELARRGAGLRDALQRVRGAVEMGMRVLAPERTVEPPDRSSGRAYLEALARKGRDRQDDREQALALAEEIREWLDGHIREQRARPLTDAAGFLAVAHLVDRHDTGSYHDRVRAFPSTHPDFSFQFSGPWPPYGFVDEG